MICPDTDTAVMVFPFEFIHLTLFERYSQDLKLLPKSRWTNRSGRKRTLYFVYDPEPQYDVNTKPDETNFVSVQQEICLDDTEFGKY